VLPLAAVQFGDPGGLAFAIIAVGLLSQPHTGLKILVQIVGLRAQVPIWSPLPQVPTLNWQYSSDRTAAE